MPKRKRRRPEEELPEKLPEEEVLPEEEEVPRVGLTPTPGPAEDREAIWTRIETEITTIKNDYIAGRITLSDAIDRIITALNAIRAAEAPGLTRLGVRPEMAFPPGPATPPIPPEEETPPVT